MSWHRSAALAIALACACPAVAAAQVAYVTEVDNYSGASVSSLTLTSVPAGTNGTVFVGATFRDTAAQTITGVTFNGSATGVSAFSTLLTTGGVASQGWCVANVSGTANVVVSFSAAVVVSAATALVFSGGATTTPCTGLQTANTSAAGTSTTAVTCASTGMFFDVIGHRDDTVAITSLRTQRSVRPPSAQGSVQHKTSTAAGASSQTMGYTWTGGISYNHIAGCLVAASGGAARPPTFLLMGVGQ
jgi:hypothetical protein